MLSLLKQLEVYTIADIAHQRYKQESAAGYAYSTTNISRHSADEKADIVPNTFKEAMTLMARVQWKAAIDKEVASLKKHKHPLTGDLYP